MHPKKPRQSGLFAFLRPVFQAAAPLSSEFSPVPIVPPAWRLINRKTKLMKSLNRYEGLNAQPATERQLQYLPPAYRHDYNLTRYKASAMMTLQFNRQAIMSAINNGRVAA